MIAAGESEATRPNEHPARQLADAIARGELERAGECFAREACFLTPDATAIRGRDSIRPVLRQLIAQGTQIEVLAEARLGAPGLELTSQRWRISTPGRGEKGFTQVTQALFVSGLVEHRWKLTIVAPWGWSALSASGA